MLCQVFNWILKQQEAILDIWKQLREFEYVLYMLDNICIDYYMHVKLLRCRGKKLTMDESQLR